MRGLCVTGTSEATTTWDTEHGAEVEVFEIAASRYRMGSGSIDSDARIFCGMARGQVGTLSANLCDLFRPLRFNPC